MTALRLALGVWAVGWGAVAAGQPIDPARLFPPGTLAYAECRDPAKLADAVAAVTKGSALDDGLKLLHDRRDANRDPRLFAGQPGLASLVTATSPEFLAEVRKLRGVAAGLTGFTPDFEPKVAVAILTGESAAAALLAKSFLANDATLRRVAVVAGVPVFQSRALPALGFDPDTGKAVVPEPAKAPAGPCEPTYAYTPGLFVVASNAEAAADVLERYRGTAGDSLADRPPIARDGREGIEFFVRLADLTATADAARKANRAAVDPAVVAYLKIVLDVRAAPLATGHLRLGPTGIVGNATLATRPDASSPLLNVVAGTAPPVVGPTNLAAFATISLPPKPGRAAAVLRLTDAVARAEGEVGRLPSEWIAEEAVRTGVDVRSLLATVQAVSVVAPDRPDPSAKGGQRPALALHLDSPAAATEWVTALPKVLGDPSAETLRGVRVLTFVAGTRTVHVARAGTVVVWGTEREFVASCCGGVGGPGAVGAPTAPKTPPPDAATAALGAVTPRGMARAIHLLSDRSRANEQLVEGPSPLPPVQPSSTEKELATVFQSCPPLVGRVSRRPDGLTVEVRFDFGPAGAKPIIEGLIPLVEKLGTTPAPANGRLFLDR